MTANKGFTLIELLIVLVIISITVGFAVIAFGDFGSSKRIHFSAEQLVNTLKMAQQQAILESGTLGLKINDKGYSILKFNNNGTWSPISNQGPFKPHYFPDKTVVILDAKSPSHNQPEIIINCTGDMTPFIIQIGTSNKNILLTLTGSHNGMLVLKTMPSP
jgi:general secretion pathway protein H